MEPAAARSPRPVRGPRGQSRRARRAPALLAVATALTTGCGGAPPGPNLLLVTVDTLRPDRLACYGGEATVGAAICSLGEAGLRYVWAISPAPSTAPAIASILTSRYPSQHGVTQFGSTRLEDSAATLAEVLAAAGYRTAAFVSNPVLAASRNLGQGFGVYDQTMTRAEPNRPDFAERDAESATRAALAWMRAAREPWFLWVHYQDPHGPYAPPGAGPARDAPRGTALPLLRDHSGYGGIPAYQLLAGASHRETYERRYLEEIRYLDRQLAELLAGLGAPSRPVGALLTADHGEAFGEDGYWFAHGHSVALDQIRVPLLWRPPGGAPAAVVTTPVSTLDVAPTLLAAAGLPPPAGFLGGVLPDPGGARAAPPIFSEHRLRAAVVVGRRYLARDRRALAGPVADRISGGWLRPMPPRGAVLGEDGRAPAYSAGDGGEPAAALDAFLAAAGARAEAEPVPLPPASQRQLEALGYLE